MGVFREKPSDHKQQPYLCSRGMERVAVALAFNPGDILQYTLVEIASRRSRPTTPREADRPLRSTMLNSMYVASIIAAALALPLHGNFTVPKAEFGKTDPAHLNDFVFDLKSPCSPGCRCPDGNCVPCCTSVHHCCPRLDGVPLGNISSMEPFSNSSDPSPLPSASP